jgi:imidazolonepropionase-like amidohydrolase
MEFGRRTLKGPLDKQILRVGWLIDGRGGTIAVDQAIVIRKDRIQSIEPWCPARFNPRDLIDLSSATALPALMDTHVHLAFSGTLDVARRQAQLRQTFEQTEQAVAMHMQAHLESGISAVRDGGDRSGRVLEIRNRQETPLHLAATCWAWHAPGRYGAMIGQAPHAGKSLSQSVADACRGADHIKLIQSGINSLDHFGTQTAPQFSQAELAAVRQLAVSRGLPVMVHANGQDAVRIALAAGCESIEHGYFMGLENLQRMADQQVFWIPTLVPMAALAHPDCLSTKQTDTARRTLEHQMEQVAAAGRLGVRIVLGTDAGSLGVDHGSAAHREMALLMEAGMSLSRAVQCATSQAANLLRLEGQGALLAGCSADLVAVPGGPERLPQSLAGIQGLCIRGIWYKNTKATECLDLARQHPGQST